MKNTITPYTSGELMRLATAVGGPRPLDPRRVLSTYADPDNWEHVDAFDANGAHVHYWTWDGPTITGYELARFALRDAEVGDAPSD